MLFDWFNKKKSASVARDRLTIAIMSDRDSTNDLPFMNDMKAEIVDVVKKYVGVRAVNIRKEIEGEVEALAIDVELDRRGVN
jgi:cell division topological specificity factor